MISPWVFHCEQMQNEHFGPQKAGVEPCFGTKFMKISKSFYDRPYLSDNLSTFHGYPGYLIGLIEWGFRVEQNSMKNNGHPQVFEVNR